MADEQLLRCPSCRSAMTRVEEVRHPDGTTHLELYQCGSLDCKRRAAMFWETTGLGLDAAKQSWVEKEVAARGCFFPTDYR